MKIKLPKLRIKELDPGIKIEVENIVKEVLNCNHIISLPIEKMTMIHIYLLGEYAKVNNLIISIKGEHSNFYQGVMVNILKKELLLNGFIEYI